jgi:chemotaxis protein MotB
MNNLMDSAELVAETEKSEDQQGWLATFADLMSLLMCFFVLLLSFSEMDVIKFKQIAGSMKTAFGVQREVEAPDIPKGTSLIAQEFSPATTEPSPINEVRQHSSEQDEPNVRVEDPARDRMDENSGRQKHENNPALFELQEQLEQSLAEQLSAGSFELDNQGQQLIIRINENGGFASGSAFLQPTFRSPLQRIGTLLADIPGTIEVVGHTDNLVLNNEMFSDNLELSAMRAVAIARVIKTAGKLRHVHVKGLADAQPLVENTSQENRARNRRVEITIRQGEAKVESLSLTQQGADRG